MGTYIIRPKQTLAELSSPLSAISMAPEKRDIQIKEVIKLRREDPTYREIDRWFADARGTLKDAMPSKSVNKKATQVYKAEITGIVIADMSEREVARMRRELPNVVIQADEPIYLIPPSVAISNKQEVSTSDLWHLKAIGLDKARQAGFQGSGAGVQIAVLDTGIDETHEELKGKVSSAFTFDDKKKVTLPMVPSIDTDGDGHGTHVAGLICGQKVGIAPGAQLLSAVMVPRRKGSLTSFGLALEWTAKQQHNVQIMNMSAGLPGYQSSLLDQIEAVASVGILSIVAIGNEGPNKTRSPGNYILPVSVGAADRRANGYGVASFSGGGTLIVDGHMYQVPDIVAPGKEVYSSKVGGGYKALDGTSMATPIVSGIAALILEKYKNMTVLELKEELLSTCLDLDLPPDRQGRGLIQVKEE